MRKDLSIPSDVAVIGVVLSNDRTKVLITRRRDVDMWVLPGGGCESNEDVETAIYREILEETGIHTSVKRLAAIYTPVNRLAKITYVFECERQSGLLMTGSETRELDFFDIQQLPKNFFSLHSDWLREILEQPTQVIKKKITQVTYFSLILFFFKHPLITLRYSLSRLGFPINSKI